LLSTLWILHDGEKGQCCANKMMFGNYSDISTTAKMSLWGTRGYYQFGKRQELGWKVN
jgi:hypothetical protein